MKPGPPPAKRVGFMTLVFQYDWFQDLGLETPGPPPSQEGWFHDPGLAQGPPPSQEGWFHWFQDLGLETPPPQPTGIS